MIGEQIEAMLREFPDTASVYSERVVGGNYIDIKIRREDAARYGLRVAHVQEVVRTAIGGMNVSWTVEDLARYPINVRYPREIRNNVESLKELSVPTPMGHGVALAQVADIEITKGPPAIKSENARTTAWIFVDLKTSDVGGYVENAKELVSKNLKLPEGVSIVWSGQYEYMERVGKRLRVVIPFTLVIIFVLLFLHFRNATESIIVMGTLPFALVGGVWLLYFFGFNLSVAVAVGPIALAGLAAETGVVMLVYLDETFDRWKAEGRIKSVSDLKTIVIEGAVERVRPKLMTVMTTTFGLLPVMFGTETETRVVERIVTPMVGGMFLPQCLPLSSFPRYTLCGSE